MDDHGLDLDTVGDLDPTAVLAALSEADHRERIAARDKLVLAYQWAILHPALEDVATWGGAALLPAGLTAAESLGGDGTPPVAAFTGEELAAVLGVSTQAGQALVADALDLVHRLPATWAHLRALRVPAWRARRLAQSTHTLTLAQARAVDATVADRLCTRSAWRLVEETIAAATAEAAPTTVAEREASARAGWDVTLHHPDATQFAGTSQLHAVGDTGDLTAFHTLVCDTATQLQALGDNDTVGQRRAKALGVLATGQALLDLTAGSPAPVVVERALRDASFLGSSAQPPTGVSNAPTADQSAGFLRQVRRRDPADAHVRLYLHITAHDLADGHGSAANTDGAAPATGWCERLGPVTLDRLQTWLTGAHKVDVQPVLHPAPVSPPSLREAVDTHDPPGWMRESVILRDQHCVFPWCGRDARTCDLDHITPYLAPDNGGPPGQTHPDNLAALCRRHHRAKTTGGWTYQRATAKAATAGNTSAAGTGTVGTTGTTDTTSVTGITPTYLWTSPTGRRYLVTPTGTTTLPAR